MYIHKKKKKKIKHCFKATLIGRVKFYINPPLCIHPLTQTINRLPLHSFVLLTSLSLFYKIFHHHLQTLIVAIIFRMYVCIHILYITSPHIWIWHAQIEGIYKRSPFKVALIGHRNCANIPTTILPFALVYFFFFSRLSFCILFSSHINIYNPCITLNIYPSFMYIVSYSVSRFALPIYVWKFPQDAFLSPLILLLGILVSTAATIATSITLCVCVDSMRKL